MTVIKLSWYTCVLFVIALVVESMVTVAPSGETAARLLMGLWAALAATFAAIAVTFRWLRLSEPRWLVRAFVGVAVVATVIVAMMVVG
jgi:hypothetical protein